MAQLFGSMYCDTTYLLMPNHGGAACGVMHEQGSQFVHTE